MQLYSVLSNAYKLDGGAMFGNAAKAVWERWMPADEQNRIHLATRALLVLTQNETILFETGIGAYMEPRFRDRYGVNEPGHMLLKSLAQKGISPADINRISSSRISTLTMPAGCSAPGRKAKNRNCFFPMPNIMWVKRRGNALRIHTRATKLLSSLCSTDNWNKVGVSF